MKGVSVGVPDARPAEQNVSATERLADTHRATVHYFSAAARERTRHASPVYVDAVKTRVAEFRATHTPESIIRGQHFADFLVHV